MDINQGLLAGVGVSHPALGQVVNVAAANGIHAKLTGAGGGGFALGLVTPAVQREQVNMITYLGICINMQWRPTGRAKGAVPLPP